MNNIPTPNAIPEHLGPVIDAAIEPEAIAPAKSGNRPDPSWVRGKCPKCGDDVVSNLYYLGGKGYYVRWECWSGTGENTACDWSKTL